MDRPDLVEIALRACSLDELIETARREATDEPHFASEDAEFLERWALAYAKGDREALVRRLCWDGLTETAVLRALSIMHSGGSLESGPGMRALEDLLAQYAATDRGSRAAEREISASLFTPGEEPAFAELWSPFVRWARRRLLEADPEAFALLGPGARRDLERHLVDQLVWTSELAVYERFRRFLAEHDDSTPVGGRDGRANYDRFVESMLCGGFVEFVMEYAGLAGQLCRILDTWLDVAVELRRRLGADLEEIGAIFGDGRSLGGVSRIRAGLSDPHNGGRTVLVLVFDSGLRLVYKPRSIDLEAAYNRLLCWLIEGGLDSTPAPIRCLQKEGYGWVEWVSPEPATTRKEVAEYFRGAGALMCIMHLLNASDLHLENVIARPGGPVVVDLETILQPRYRIPGAGDETGGVSENPGSLLDAGLLAAYQVDLDGRVEDIGGLAGGAPPTQRARRWASINTDAMQPMWRSTRASRHNVISYRGEPQQPEDFADEIASGFAAAHRFLRDHRDEMTAAESPLSWFRDLHTRWVYRPSDVYARVLVLLRTPRYQRDCLSQGLLVDSLNRGFRRQPDRPDIWPFVAEERRSLLGLDVPYFTAPTDRPDLRSPDGEVLGDFFDAAGLDVVEQRLRGYDEKDLDRQLRILDRVLRFPDWPSAGSVDRAGAAPRRSVDAGDAVTPGAGGGGDPMVRAAANLAEQVRAVAADADDGSLTWAGLGTPDTGKDAGPLGTRALYCGDVGVLLFFAALARVTGNEAGRHTVLAAIPRIAADLDGDDRAKSSRPTPLGACNGLGGIVWALTWIGILLDDRDPVRLASSLAHGIGEEAIAADSTYDVAGGVAGAILGLLALSAHTGEPWPIERAAACGDHLVSAARPASGGGSGWASSDGLMLAGMAHGAAGIATALARLFGVTGREEYRNTAAEAYRYERSLFDHEEMNWPMMLRPDPVGDTERIFVTTWCHGAPGIALARIGGLGAISDREVRAEIDVALEITGRFGVGSLDHLCCGNMGRVDAFLTAGRRFGNLEHKRAAAMRLVKVLERYLDTGGLGLCLPGTDGPDVVHGFFQGYSGIGYQLLRFAYPDQIPSVLAFEAPEAAGSIGNPE